MSRFALALFALPALAACATTGADAARGAPVNAEARAAVAHEDMLTQMTFWAGEYEAHPDDLEAAQQFAEALRKGGRADRAAQVAMGALQRNQGDSALLMTLGRALISAGRPQDALRPLALAAAGDAQNWTARSALGAALDQLGRFEDARRAYAEALAISPNEARVLSNLGMSHLLSGDPVEAEAVLRQAVAALDPPPAARQNLAIAVALQGRFDEAEQLERIDLPPQVAAANMAYLRGLISDPRRWGDLGRTSRE